MGVTRLRDADEREHGDDDDHEADEIDEVVHGGAPLLLSSKNAGAEAGARRITEA